MVLTWPFISDIGEYCLCIVQVSWETVHLELRVFHRRWSQNGHLSMTLGKTLHVHFSGLLTDSALQVSRVLLRRWFLSGCSLVTLWKTLHTHCVMSPRKEHSLSQYNTFTQKMVLKWPFISPSGEDCTFIIQLLQDTELFQSEDFNLKYDLEMAVGETWEDSTFIVHVSQEKAVFESVHYFYLEDGLEMAIHWWDWGRLCI